MKRVIAFACCTSLTLGGFALPVVAGPGSSAGTASQSRGDIAEPPRANPTRIAQPDQGFCRGPAPLPNLGAEVSTNQQQRPARPTRRTGAARASSDDTAISVTGSRVERSVSDVPVSMAPAPPAESSAYSGASAADSSRIMPRPPIPGPVPPRPPQPQPQAGLLTAGEHDDLLNPELYEEYRRNSNLGQSVQALPAVDTGRLLTVELRDRRGRSVPFGEVEVRCSDGNSITLKTVADGRAVFFPGLDRLSEDVWIRAGGSDWRSVRLSSDAGAGGQTVQITQRQRAAEVRQLDLALVVDVTGSMSDELSYLQSELTSIIGALETRHSGLDVRVAFTFYRDEGDEFVTRSFDFDGNLRRAQTRIGQQRAAGGGDYPEAMQDAMVRAAQMEWRDDAVKTLLLVADAPPHNHDVAQTWLAAQHLRSERVHIVPVGASGVADMAEYVMRAMAAVTQSRYTFLTDDSGIGNPHAAPSVDCYLVTRLDHLLRRVIDSQISGRRVEPARSEIVRAVGEYDAGRCVLPANFSQRSADNEGQGG